VKIRRWHLAALLLTALWLFVRGVPLDAATILGELILGGVIAVVIAWVFRRLYDGHADLSQGFLVLPQAVAYIASFLKELVVANLDVVYRVVHPAMPIEPAVIYLPLRVERPTAVSTIANSISLTPGTLSMDYDEDENALYVHTIDGSDPAGVVEPIRRWEDRLLIIFAEDADPDDPAPAIEVGGDVDGE
jgi:multicomponent Na+:H+ antiporter subunit E